MELKIERMIKTKESMEKNKLLLKQRQEEISRQEVEETKKCEEEVAKRNKISLARADLEKKHFEQSEMISFVVQFISAFQTLFLVAFFLRSKCNKEDAF
jgi:hypothetical protein